MRDIDLQERRLGARELEGLPAYVEAAKGSLDDSAAWSSRAV